MKQREHASKYKVLILLTGVWALNGMERGALGIVLPGIKADLNLTDTQLGLLTGIAFAFFYAVVGLPMARWSDRGNRTNIISISAALWSAAIALCGIAYNFVQLLCIRVAVAIGEAGGGPSSYSLLADYFERSERPRAAAILGIGAPLGSVIALPFAGLITDRYGWRTTMFCLAIPGLLVALLVFLFVYEPRRSAPASEVTSSESPPGLLAVCRLLISQPTFRQLLLTLAVMYFFLYGIVIWQPTYLARTFEMSSAQSGVWLGISTLGAVLGSILGGELASRLAPNDERKQLRGVALTIAGCGVLSVAAYAVSNGYLALTFIGMASFFLYMVNAPIVSSVQTLVPPNMVATAFALLLLAGNLIGMGLGPLAAGALSDAFQSAFGDQSLRFALLILSLGYFRCATHAWLAASVVPSGRPSPRPTS